MNNSGILWYFAKVKEEEVILEAQVCLQELKKMDPVAIFKSVKNKALTI